MSVVAALLSGCAAFAAAGGLTRVIAVRRLFRVARFAVPEADGGLLDRPAERGGEHAVGSASHGQTPAFAGRQRWTALSTALAARRTEHRNRSEVIALCAALVAELRAGRHPPDALARAGRAHPASAPHAVRAAHGGGDVCQALRLDAAGRGREGLRRLAACWQVAEQHGPGLADAVGALGGSLRADAQHHRRVAAELAGPLATARLLAALPVVGILMGQALGTAPLHFLFGSSLGWADLAAGVVLEALGLWWVSRIAGHATRRRPDGHYSTVR